MFYPTDKIAIFIDGLSLWNSAKIHNVGVDYKKLHAEFRKRGKLTRAFYYTTMSDNEDFSPVRKLVDFLSYNGYVIRTQTIRENDSGTGLKKASSYMRMRMAMDAISLSDHLDHLILMSGDGELTPLVEELQRRGVRVSVCAAMTPDEVIISDDLRRQADNFIEFGSIKDIIGMERRDG